MPAFLAKLKMLTWPWLRIILMHMAVCRKTVDTAIGVGHGIVLQTSAIQQQIKLPLKDASCCCAIGVVGQKDVVVSTSLRISLLEVDDKR